MANGFPLMYSLLFFVPHDLISFTFTIRWDTRAFVYGVERNTSDCQAPGGTRGMTVTDVWHRQQNRAKVWILRVFPAYQTSKPLSCFQADTGERKGKSGNVTYEKQ